MTSKYDYVKIKVYLKEDNFFILSRFLLSKMLVFSRVPSSVAVRISLEVKKHFVDRGMLTITDPQLKHELFETMKKYGCGDAFIAQFRQLSEFQAARVPLIVLVGGTACTGKSTVAHMLGSRLSNFHVVNTDVVLETITAIDAIDASNASSPSPPPPHPHWMSLSLATDSEALAVWQRQCELVATHVKGELTRALREGKAIIVEGACVNMTQFQDYVCPIRLQATYEEAMRTAAKPLKSHRRITCSPIVTACLLKMPDDALECPLRFEAWVKERGIPMPAPCDVRNDDDADDTAAPSGSSRHRSMMRRCAVVQDCLLQGLDEEVLPATATTYDGSPALRAHVMVEDADAATVVDHLHAEILRRISLELERLHAAD